MRVFYIRCSQEDQNEARQVEMARTFGAERIFVDKRSGKDLERAELKRMLDFVRDGDVVGTESISRIARNTRDLLTIVEHLKEKGVAFVSLKENIDTETPAGQFMLTVFGALAQLERENIRQRQAEGIAIAKSAGKYKGRPPMKIDERQFRKAVADWRAGTRTATSIQKEFGISGTTFYRWLKQKT